MSVFDGTDGQTARVNGSQRDHGRELRNWTWEEFADAAPTIPFFVLAAGSVEQHGPHLPLGADSMVSETLARLIAQQHGAVLLPALPVGINYTFASWPGTVSMSPAPFTEMVIAVAGSVSAWCPRLLIVNGHDENHEALVLAARELVSSGMDVVVFEWAEFVLDEIRRVTESTSEMHAGEALTSLLLHWHPELVRREKIVDGVVFDDGDLLADDLHSERRLFRPLVIRPGGGDRGVFGHPTLATPEKGKAIASALERRAAEMIRELSWLALR